MTNISNLIPEKLKAKVNTLAITDAALAELKAIADAHGADVHNAVKCTAICASHFIAGGYFKDAWFRSQQLHRFAAVDFHAGGETHRTELCFDAKAHTVLGSNEATLPENYDVERVIAETRVEMGLSKL